MTCLTMTLRTMMMADDVNAGSVPYAAGFRRSANRHSTWQLSYAVKRFVEMQESDYETTTARMVGISNAITVW
jgi:hypothetical protein